MTAPLVKRKIEEMDCRLPAWGSRQVCRSIDDRSEVVSEPEPAIEPELTPGDEAEADFPARLNFGPG